MFFERGGGQKSVCFVCVDNYDFPLLKLDVHFILINMVKIIFVQFNRIIHYLRLLF